MAELKPCPFCGKPVSMVYRSNGKAFMFYHKDSMGGVKCRVNEPIEFLGCMSLAEAAEAWNRRVNNE